MNKIDELLQELDIIAQGFDDRYGIPWPLHQYKSEKEQEVREKTISNLENAVKQFLVTELNEFVDSLREYTDDMKVIESAVQEFKQRKGYDS